ncbi:hypothetical protein OBV_01830 [Oscillibacter valericigenes Sjm18-20]|nr:hypothetical protein OBV_01830 [Oscillibacter valericigenes Sjm18-20]
MDIYTEAEIRSDISRIEILFRTNIFDSANINNPLSFAAFIETVIILRDLVKKCEIEGHKRIDFTDDIIISSKIHDVTDLIEFVRNAVCHINSPNSKIGNNRINCCCAVGKTKFIQINGKEITSDYEDDICYFFGEQKIYLIRHISRAFNETRAILFPLLQ